MKTADFLSRLENVSGNGKQFSARCPAHDDRCNSLSVSEGREGKILVHCHAGCSVKDITRAMGLTTQELFPDGGSQPVVVPWKNAPDRKGGEYIYYDESGLPVLKKTKRRKDDGSKYFFWEHLENNKWVKGRNGIAPPLYNQAVLKKSNMVFVVEGEKDTDTMNALGYETVCLADGASSRWLPEYTDLFREKDVYIIPDNDDPGREYAFTVADNVFGTANKVKILNLKDIWPEIPEKADITDYRQTVEEENFYTTFARLCIDTPDWNPKLEAEHRFEARSADSFIDEEIEFVWDPYIPKGDFTVLMAEGGTGKTMLCCGISAGVSKGENIIGDRAKYKREPGNVLFISAEDRGSLIKKRLIASGADLKKIFILDCNNSIDLNFGDGFSTFKDTVMRYNPELVIVDPWHAFVGARVDINKINAVRPIFQKLASLAKECNCGLVLISHVNKKAQSDNANNAAFGSADFINAARSAMRVIADREPGKKDYRIVVHTKSNYAPLGDSVEYYITDKGGLHWSGFSEITKQILEESARHNCNPSEYIAQQEIRNAKREKLISAIEEVAKEGETVNISYEEFQERFGSDIFGTSQPKKALDDINFDLQCRWIQLQLGKKVKYNGKSMHGFAVHMDEH